MKLVNLGTLRDCFFSLDLYLDHLCCGHENTLLIQQSSESWPFPFSPWFSTCRSSSGHGNNYVSIHCTRVMCPIYSLNDADPKCTETDLKKSQICPIGGQSDPIWMVYLASLVSPLVTWLTVISDQWELSPVTSSLSIHHVTARRQMCVRWGSYGAYSLLQMCDLSLLCCVWFVMYVWFVTFCVNFIM